MTKQSIFVDSSNGGCYAAHGVIGKGAGDTNNISKKKNKSSKNNITNAPKTTDPILDSVVSSDNNNNNSVKQQHQQRGLDLPVQQVIKVEQEDFDDFVGGGELSPTTDLTSPLARCMTKEEIELLSKNSASSLEKELIEYLKMQQQQQHFHHQQQQHQQQHFDQESKPHFNNGVTTQNNQHPSMPIMSQRKSPQTPSSHMNASKQSMHHQHHQQQSSYQNLSNTPAAQNLSSPTDIANYMSGQNPMDSLNQQQHHHHHHNHPHFPLSISQIKKEVDYDHNGM